MRWAVFENWHLRVPACVFNVTYILYVMLAGLLPVTVDVAAQSGIRSFMRHWMSYVIPSFISRNRLGSGIPQQSQLCENQAGRHTRVIGVTSFLCVCGYSSPLKV